MSIIASTSPDGRSLTIAIGGRFDFSEHKAFRDAYAQVEVKNVAIVVDLKNTEYLDSSALGMLLVLRERAGGDRADIILRGAREGISEVLSISRFGQLFTIE